MKILLALALSACAASAKPVASPDALQFKQTNYALQFARASFPTGDSIAIGEHTAIVRDALVLAMCVEVDAAHHTQCVAIKDFTPPKPVETPQPNGTTSGLPTPPEVRAANPAGPPIKEAPKKK